MYDPALLPEIPQLTDTYHKARRNYGLFSAFLLIWELFGIEIGKKPVPSYDISFKTPQAAQIILITLIFYFAFRITIEWFQCSYDRRRYIVSKIDFYTAHAIGILSIGVFLYQQSANIQIAEYINVTIIFYALAPVGAGYFCGDTSIRLLFTRNLLKYPVATFFILLFWLYLSVSIILSTDIISTYVKIVLWLIAFLTSLFNTKRKLNLSKQTTAS